MSNLRSYESLEKIREKNLGTGHEGPSIPKIDTFDYTKNEKNVYSELERSAVRFIRESCKNLNYKTDEEHINLKDFDGKSRKKNVIPFNMEKDIDRLTFEKALTRFLRSGRKEDAFDVYFCFLDMFFDYGKTEDMIEMLSEYENNGSSLLMKHRDHYVHSVYVFSIGLTIFENNVNYRKKYGVYYEKLLGKNFEDYELANHFLRNWGFTALFHDIGYPFELPFEQIESYFEKVGRKRREEPFVAYNNIGELVNIDKELSRYIAKYVFEDPEASFDNTNELFAYVLHKKFADKYMFTKEQMKEILMNKAIHPEKYNYFMDHAYFSANILFKKFFDIKTIKEEIKGNNEDLRNKYKEYINVLIAILMHNSLYKYSIAYIDKNDNRKLRMEDHPLSYLLMLCDELQTWGRTSYGRKKAKEIHPFDADFYFENNTIKVEYVFDEIFQNVIEPLQEEINDWKNEEKNIKGDEYEELRKKAWEKREPKIKSFSSIYSFKNQRKEQEFKTEIEKIVDLTSDMKLEVVAKFKKPLDYNKPAANLSDNSFTNLDNFACVLHGLYTISDEQKKNDISKVVSDEKNLVEFKKNFNELSLEYKISNINEAKAITDSLNSFGYYYTSKNVNEKPIEDLSDIAESMAVDLHKRWLEEHIQMGWKYDAILEKGNNNMTKEDYEKYKYEHRYHKKMLLDNSKVNVTKEEARTNLKRFDDYIEKNLRKTVDNYVKILKNFCGFNIYKTSSTNKLEKIKNNINELIRSGQIDAKLIEQIYKDF